MPQALIVFSRVGVYERLPGVDVERFAESMQSGGIMGYIDALSGGSISKVGVFSLGAPSPQALSPDPASQALSPRRRAVGRVRLLCRCLQCRRALPASPNS